MTRLALALTLALVSFAPLARAQQTSRFEVPDVGEGRTPYACSFHWFRVADGRVVGIDLIRSDDTGRLGLRVFVISPDGSSVRALLHEAPAAQWSFSVVIPALSPWPETRNKLGRGPGWISGDVTRPGPVKPGELRSVSFELHLAQPQVGHAFGDLGTDLANLRAVDYLRVVTRGWMRIDGERIEVDAPGSISVHHGAKLPEYSYVLTLPSADPADPVALVAAGGRDNLKVGGELLGASALTYGRFLEGGKHTLAVAAGAPRAGGVFEAWRRELIVTDVLASVPHALLGRPTTTFVARARLKTRAGGGWSFKPPVVRQVLVVGDVSGALFHAPFALTPPVHAAPSSGLAGALGASGSP